MLNNLIPYNAYSIGMSATKRIPVSEETWKELGKKKEPGQTWDDLLEQLHIKAMRNQVASKATRAKDGDLETVSLDDV
jgi:hypothetical protein